MPIHKYFDTYLEFVNYISKKHCVIMTRLYWRKKNDPHTPVFAHDLAFRLISSTHLGFLVNARRKRFPHACSSHVHECLLANVAEHWSKPRSDWQETRTWNPSWQTARCPSLHRGLARSAKFQDEHSLEYSSREVREVNMLRNLIH